MTTRLLAVAFFAALALPFGAHPTEPAPAPVKLEAEKLVTVRIGQQCVVTAATNAKKVTWKTPPGIDALPLDGKRLAVWAVEGTYRLTAMVPSGDDVLSTEIILTVTGPRPPPVPPEPGPTPTPPEPQPPTPLTSFRVIFPYESANTLTAAQSGVIFAKSVREYLNSHCTKEQNHPDCRWYDQNVNTAGEYPNMKALWDAVKPKLTVLPCMVVERNGKAEILPLPATDDEALAILKQYGGP